LRKSEKYVATLKSQLQVQMIEKVTEDKSIMDGWMDGWMDLS